jgi:hypothetical protein
MLRGIDVKQVFLQTNSVEKVQQAQQQHSDMQQRYLEIQLSEEKKVQKEHVNYSEESEKARIGQKKEEERRKGADKKKADEANEIPDRPEQAQDEENRGKRGGRTETIHIDIKV